MQLHSAALLATGFLLVAGLDPPALAKGNLEPAPWACASTHSVKHTVTIEFPGFALKIEIERTPEGGHTLTFTNTSNQPLTGCLTFKDADGNTVGTPQDVNIPPGGSTSVSAPEGATCFEISDQPCDEPEPEKAKQVKRSGGAVLHATRPTQGAQQGAVIGIGARPRPTKYSFASAPLSIDPFDASRTFAITVHTSNKSHAEAIRDHVSAFGFDLPLPNFASVSHVEVHYYLESLVDYANMDIEFIYANDDAFASLALEVNGIPNVLTLPQGETVVTGNGWDAVKLSLPLTDRALNYDATRGAEWENAFEAVIVTTDPFELSPTIAGGELTFVSD